MKKLNSVALALLRRAVRGVDLGGSRASWFCRSSVAVLLAAAGAAHADVGVSDGGDPTFVQQIAVPPGIRGMAPLLSLAYAGGNVNGALGYGWSLQAGSFITRCPATIATDGRKIAIANGADDKLCLNGQRLIRLNASGTPVVGVGTNDAAGVASGSYNEFRTESDSYFRIRSYGYAGNDSTGASGPAYFKVWTKAGQIIEYGNSPSSDANTNALMTFSGSTVGMVWATTRMSDVVGNHIDYKYEQRDVAWGSGSVAGTPGTGREQNLLEVQYSGNKVVFNYADRASSSPQDANEAYNPLGKSVSLRRLNSITTYVNSPNTTVLGPAAAAVATQTTKLTYDSGPISKRSRLVKFQVCAGAATSTRCLPGWSFSYAAGGNDAFVAATAFNQSTLPMQSSTNTYGVITADFNGDGRTDIIRWSAASPAQNQLLVSNGDGSFSSASNFNLTSQTLFSADGCYVTFVADVDGDGLPDLIRSSAATLSPTGTICTAPTPSLVLHNNGDGTFTSSTYTGPALLRDAGHNFYLLDYDGDGKVDLVTAVSGTGHTSQIGVYSLSCGDPSGICTHVYHGNGDGTFTEVATNVGPVPVGYGPAPASDPNLVGRISDFDGDGLQDIGGIYNGDSRILLANGLRSRGDGNFDVLTNNACQFPIDFNGDGRADCLDPNLRQLWSNPGTNAVANFNLTATGQELAGTGIGFVVADVNGDGRQDIIRWKDDPSQNVVYLSNGDGTFTTIDVLQPRGRAIAEERRQRQSRDSRLHGAWERRDPAAADDRRPRHQPALPEAGFDAGGPAPERHVAEWRVDVVLLRAVDQRDAGVVAQREPGPRYASDRGTSNATTFPTLDVTAADLRRRDGRHRQRRGRWHVQHRDVLRRPEGRRAWPRAARLPRRQAADGRRQRQPAHDRSAVPCSASTISDPWRARPPSTAR